MGSEFGKGTGVCLTAFAAILMAVIMILPSGPVGRASAASASMDTDKDVYGPTDTIVVTSSWSGCANNPSLVDDMGYPQPNVWWNVVGAGQLSWWPATMTGSGSNTHYLYAHDLSLGAHTITMYYAYQAVGSGMTGYYLYYSITAAFSIQDPSAASATMQLNKDTYYPIETVVVTSSWTSCAYNPSLVDDMGFPQPNVWWNVAGAGELSWWPATMTRSGIDTHNIPASSFSYGSHSITMNYAYQAIGSGMTGYYLYHSITDTFSVVAITAIASTQTNQEGYHTGETVTVTSSWSYCAYSPTLVDDMGFPQPNIYWTVVGAGELSWWPATMTRSGTYTHSFAASALSYGAHTITTYYAYQAIGSGMTGYYLYSSISTIFYVEEPVNSNTAVSNSNTLSVFKPSTSSYFNQTVIDTVEKGAIYTINDYAQLGVAANMYSIERDTNGNQVVTIMLQADASTRKQLNYEKTEDRAAASPYETYPNTAYFWHDALALKSKNGATLENDDGFLINLRTDVYDSYRLFYCGKWYDGLWVSTNGFVIPVDVADFNSPAHADKYPVGTWMFHKPDETNVYQQTNPVMVPALDGVDGLIAPLWADHNIDHSGSIHYGVISYPDYPGSGSLCYSYVVAWNQIGEQDGTGAWTTHTFAVAFQFDPNSPDNIWWRAITFLYGDVNQFAHGCYCVGLETQTGNTGVAVDHAKAVDNWVLKFEPNDAHGLVVKDIRLEAGKGSGERFYSQIEIFGPQKVGVAPNENPAGGYNVVAVDADTVNAWKDTQQSALRHALWQGASATVRTGLVIVDPSGTGVLSALYGWGRTAYYLSEYFKYVPFPDYDQISEMGIVTPCHAKVVCRDEGIPAGWGGERNYYAYDSCLATKIVWTIFPTDNPIPVSLKFRASVTLRDTSSYYTPVGLDTVADSGQWTTITVYPSLITDNGINGNSWSARTFPDAHYVRSATGTTDNIPGHTGWPFYHMDCAGRPAGETGYSAVSWTKLTENLLDNHFVTKQQDVLRISGFFKKSDSAPLNVYIVRAKDMDFLGSGSIDDVLVKEVLLAADQHGWINVAAKDIDLSAYAHLLPNPTPENPDPRLFVKVCIGMDVSDPLKSYEVFFSGVGIQTVGPAQAPNPPQNLAAAGGHGAIVLSWTAPTYDGGASVTLYKIYGGATSGSEPFLADVIAPTLMYTNLGLANGAKFYYKVTAVNTAGQSVFSNEASATTWTIPSEPTSLVATPGNQQVVLAWSSPTSNGGDPVDLYKIYKGTTSGGETYLAQVGGTILTYTSTGLTNGLTYYFKVSAVNAAGEGPLSNEASATPSVPTVPGAPKNLAATSAPTGISLIWAAPDVGVPNHYNIYRGTRAGLETLYASTIDATTSYTDTGATPGKRYFYYVSAVNSVGAGPASNEVKCTWAGGPPSAPQNLIAAPGNGQVKLTWSAPSTNGGATISGYRIYRGPTSGGEAYVTQVSGTTLTYTNTGLTNGLIYYFKVTALNSNGEGPFSNEVSASPTSATSPGAPLGLTAVPSGNAIHLAWSPPSSNGGSTITGYNIYRGTRSGVETYLGWVPGSSTFFDDGSAAKGKKYFYKVSAVNVVGEGPMSNEASATIPRAAAATIIGSTILLSEPSVDAQLLESWMAAGSFEAKATSLAVPEMRTAAA